MKIKEVLIAARELISVPERWTRGSYGRLEDGTCAYGTRDGVVCWCAIGAIQKITGREGHILVVSAFVEQVNELTDLAIYNDTHAHEEVLALFDKAIEACDETE